MADVTIGGLPAASLPLTGAELIELEQGGASGKGVIDALLPPNYIDSNGLILEWVSGNALAVSGGAAYIPSLGRVVRVGAPISKSGLSLPASAFSHAYLDGSGASPDIVISPTAPAAPYLGTARTMTGDTSKRYIGSLLSDASGALLQFVHMGNKFLIVGNPNQRILGSFTSNVVTSISVASVMPITGKGVVARIGASAAVGPVFFIGPTSGQWFGQPSPGGCLADIPVIDGNVYAVWNGTPSDGFAAIDVLGFIFER